MSGKVKTLDALTGLRFIAALAVFVHHISGKFGISKVHWPLGAQAVSFFFVLSGFILTYVYHDRLKWGGLKKFYFTRWARIWPLHLVCLLLILGLAHNLRLFSSDEQHWYKLFANIFLLQSWVPQTPYAFSFNGVSWSISTEMFFYLMFPLFLLGGQKQFWYKYAGLLLFTVLLVAGLTMVSHTSWFPVDEANAWHVSYTRLGHNNPLLRLPEFCTGMAVGFIYLNREKAKALLSSAASAAKPRTRSLVLDTILEIAAFGAIVGYQWTAKQFSFYATVANADWGGPFLTSFLMFTSGCFVFAGVIYLFSKSQGLISRFCSTRWMVFLGEVSFAFYMIHMLVIRLVGQYSKFYGDLSPVILVIAVGLFALAASILLYKVVEMPCKNGLLSLYDRKWLKGISAVPKAAFDFARTGLCTLTILLVVVPFFVLSQYKFESAPSVVINEVVQNSDPEFRGISFDKKIVLLGYDVHPQRTGWKFTLAWEKQSDFSHSRYIHICDENDNVVSHGPREEERFSDAQVGERIIDSFFLPNEKLKTKDAVKICVGFHKVGEGMLRVKKGPRSMRNRKLDLVTSDKFTRLDAIHEPQTSSKQASRPDMDKETDQR